MSDLFVELTAPNGHKYKQPRGLFINNEFVKSKAGETITSINPRYISVHKTSHNTGLTVLHSDESEIVSVYAAGEEDVNDAVAAARKAFKSPDWRDMDTNARADILFKFAQLIEEHRETLATIETWDNGKPYQVSFNDDLGEVIGTIKYYAGYANKIHGQVIDTSSAKLAYTLREPLGVCGQIIPYVCFTRGERVLTPNRWNFPLAMAAWKLGPALCTGNTVVLKAAEQTPLSILYLGTLVKEAGFPPGVINFINGEGRKAGAALAQHPDVAKIAFTGSTATGKEIMKMAAGTMKNITLETGGKSPLLVFDDADLDQAVKWSHVGIM